MGSSFQQYYWMNFLLLLVFIHIPHASCCFSSIFSFGDSLADTGNLKISSPNETVHFFFPPYGMTYFHLPTGRCSDGRLVIDFIGMHPLAVYLTFSNLSSFSIHIIVFSWISRISACSTLSRKPEKYPKFWRGSEFRRGRSHGAWRHLSWRNGSF